MHLPAPLRHGSRQRRLARLLAFACACATLPASAETLYLLTQNGMLATTSTSAPSSTSAPLAITGVTQGETLVAIDVRPQNQKLYALGVNAAANTATLYHLAPETGVAAVVGTQGSIAFTTNGTTALDFPDPATDTWDIDFNPVADRLRVVAGGLNFRVNPNTGAAVDGNNGNSQSVAPGINPDGAINGAITNVNATAYANNQPNGTITTQYTVDASFDTLFIQNPPNAGTQTQSLPVTFGGAPLDFSRPSLDIAPGVNAQASNSPVSAGGAFLVARVGGVTGLYSLNLLTGVATLLGTIPLEVIGSATRPDLGAALALSADATTLVRFAPTTPGTTSTVTITGLSAGETLVGIDGRPQTGQLYGLGVNATANTATFYLVDPQTGALSVIGTPSAIAFVDAGGAPVDLPDPATAGYGMDFNPSLDRLRVVTGNGLNFRVNPNSGAPVDGNLNIVVGNPPQGTNTDGPINGSGITGLEAVAYTNSFGQSITGVGATIQYTLSASTNQLSIQNSFNSGTQTSPVTITLGGAPLDFGAQTGFDIPVDVATKSSADGWIVAAVGGTTGIYRFDLASGEATSLGALGVGTAPASSLVVWATVPKLTLTGDAVTAVTGVTTRLYPLANDELGGDAVITSVSAPGVLIEGRTLLIPANFNGSFTYDVSAAALGSKSGQGAVTVTPATTVTSPRSFNGMLFDVNGDIIGWANAAVTSRGIATVKVNGGAASVSTRVTLPAGGNNGGGSGSSFTTLGNLVLTRNPNGTLGLTLAALGGPIGGTLRAALSDTPLATHHIALASVDATVPGGGFAIAKTSRKAAVSIKGTLPDGLSFTASTTVRDNGSLAFYTTVSGGNPPAVLGGELVAANLATTDLTGELVYMKLPQVVTAKRVHSGGLDTVLTANGCLYTGVGPGLSGAGTLRLSGGDLTVDQNGAVSISTRGVPTGSTLITKWTAAATKTGTFTAAVRLPNASKTIKATGIYLPKSKTAWGYFPGATKGGRIELTVP